MSGLAVCSFTIALVFADWCFLDVLAVFLAFSFCFDFFLFVHIWLKLFCTLCFVVFCLRIALFRIDCLLVVLFLVAVGSLLFVCLSPYNLDLY